MKINRKKAAAVAVAAIMTCGLFAGCDLVTRNEAKNMQQTIAEVNITESENFKTEFGTLNTDFVNKAIKTASISKRDMIAMFISSGYSNYVGTYGYEYVFNAISESLSQRQLLVQYAKAYFLKNGWTDEEGNKVEYNELSDLTAFNNKIEGKEGVDYDIAVLQYFLTDKEIVKADYTTRVMFNNSIDSLEDKYIEKKEDDTKYDSDVRTTPKGLNTTNSDYFSDKYQVYTGTGTQSGVHVYEPKEGSTTTTRLRAYNDLLTSLKSNSLVKKGEDTSDVESLEYFKLENKTDYEDALIQKLTDEFEKQAEGKLTQTYLEETFASTLQNQKELYGKSASTLEGAMDSVSDTNFVLTATGNSKKESAFGYVINILLPFSAAQSDVLSSVTQDFGDKYGNKFATRAQLLKLIRATDQRGSWFRGETDYSFKAASGAFPNGDSERVWLFFEDNLNDNKDKDNLSKYDRLKNYYGQYTYNGTWDEKDRKYKPNRITIDDFIGEMEEYLKYALPESATLETTKTYNDPSDPNKNKYYQPDDGYYYKADDPDKGIKKGDVNYEQFVYYQGKVNFAGGFNANQIFKANTPENVAMSVINELSFAYNTDTGGLNSYLGYAVTANKTSFVSEFEYAAQKVVKEGAGNYIVVPSDYGWHIIYCTFSFVDYENGAEGDIKSPFKFVYDDINDEGTFSNLFYEDLKADTGSKESTTRSSMIVSKYKKSYTIYEDRYSDLTNIGNN